MLLDLRERLAGCLVVSYETRNESNRRWSHSLFLVFPFYHSSFSTLFALPSLNSFLQPSGVLERGMFTLALGKIFEFDNKTYVTIIFLPRVSFKEKNFTGEWRRPMFARETFTDFNEKVSTNGQNFHLRLYMLA